MTFAAMKLGKKAAEHDPRTLKFADYLDDATLPPIPLEADWGKKVSAWLMFLNDDLGDCTCAATAHMLMGWSSEAGVEIVPTDNDVLKMYEAVGHYKPGHPNTDNGAVILHVLKYWRKTGLAGHKIGAFASVQTSNMDHIKLAIAFFGGCNIGVQLPISAQGQKEWTVTDKSLTGDAKPGSWGGHSIDLIAFKATGPVCVTWGQELQMTWEFFEAYCDEAYAIIDASWFEPNGSAPSGLNMAALTADLAAL